MRVNPNHTDSMLAALQRLNANETEVLRQISSGQRIQNPCDGPAALASLVQLQNSDDNTKQYLLNGSAVRSQMQMSDSTLNSVVIGLERALSLGVSGGGSGTLNADDRNAIAMEIDGIRDNLLDLANTSLQGSYLFAGTNSGTKPFDESSGTVIYKGSSNTNQVQIGEGLWIRSSVAGNGIFGLDGASMFDALQSLSQAVRAGTGVETSMNALSAARDRVSSSRVVYGNALNQIDSAELVMNQRHIQLAQQETDLAGTDMADAATNLASAETARNALLATIGKADATSLFDYLK